MFILKNLVDRHTHKGASLLFTCFVDFKRAFDKVWQDGLFYKLRQIGVSDKFYHTIKSMYDTVWQDGLFYKLRQIGVSDKFYHTIKSMYASTKLSVKIGDSSTNTFSSATGVRQGDKFWVPPFLIFL